MPPPRSVDAGGEACPPTTWLPVFTSGSFGLWELSKAAVNAIYQNEASGVVRRECPRCAASHRDIYMKRLTDPRNFDLYSSMFGWARAGNLLHTDFELFSTEADALAGTNPWQYCNYGTVGGDVVPGEGGVRECFEHNTSYSGNDVGSVQALGSHNCQSKCQQNKACRFFAWDGGSKECHLKSSNAGEKESKRGVVFGPELCFGTMDGVEVQKVRNRQNALPLLCAAK